MSKVGHLLFKNIMCIISFSFFLFSFFVDKSIVWEVGIRTLDVYFGKY